MLLRRHRELDFGQAEHWEEEHPGYPVKRPDGGEQSQEHLAEKEQAHRERAGQQRQPGLGQEGWRQRGGKRRAWRTSTDRGPEKAEFGGES